MAMYRIPGYVAFFVALALLQVFLFDNLNLGTWVHPLVYIAFVVLLPMEMRSVWVLVLGLAMGVAIDFGVSQAGLNTIAMLATAFVRRPVLLLMVGKETVGDGGAPCATRIGEGRFVRYCAAMVVIHCAVYFLFEAASVSWFYLTASKILLSSVVTTGLVYVVQLMFRK